MSPVSDSGRIETARELRGARSRSLGRLRARGEVLHGRAPLEPEKTADGTHLGSKISHQPLVAHLVPLEAEQRPGTLGKVHDRVV